MRFLLTLIILMSLSSLGFAQQITSSQYAQAQQDLISRNAAVDNDNNTITTAQADIVNQQASITADNATIYDYNLQNAQSTAAWNLDQDALYESEGYRWAKDFPNLYPHANLTAIQNQLISEGLTCSVQEQNVTWTNWPAYAAIHCPGEPPGLVTDHCWINFYCAQGPSS